MKRPKLLDWQSGGLTHFLFSNVETLSDFDFEILKLSFPQKNISIREVDFFLFPKMKAAFRSFELFYVMRSVIMLEQTPTQLYC